MADRAQVVTARQELLDAWANWDAHPSSEVAVSRLVGAEKVYGGRLGLDHAELRGLLAAWRRAHRDRDAALRAVEAGVAETP